MIARWSQESTIQVNGIGEVYCLMHKEVFMEVPEVHRGVLDLGVLLCIGMKACAFYA